MIEYKPKYNPADNAEVENIASKMSKPELEEYYVKDRNKRHSKCGDVIGTIIVVLIMVSFIGGLGYIVTQGAISDNVEYNMREISQEVCPHLGEGYTSQEVMNPDYGDIVRIVCDQTNSNWQGK